MKRKAPHLLRTLASCPTWRGRLYRPPYAFPAAWASCWLCFLCCEKHHSCSLLRDIHSYAFLMQPAIFPRSSEARVDNPNCQAHCMTRRTRWVEGSLGNGGSALLMLARHRFLAAAPHALASARTHLTAKAHVAQIYLRNNQKRRVEMTLEMK